MNMHSQSNAGEDNGATPAASARFNEELPRNDFPAPPNQELRRSLNTIMDFTKQLEMHCGNDRMTHNVKQILRAAHDCLDIINREVAEPGYGHHPPSATPNSPYDVLYIEDDSTTFSSVKLLLGSKRKLKVLQAKNGETGIALAERHPPRLILLDLDLPDVHGSEVIQHLQKQPATARIPVVVISGDTTPSQIERLLVLGARNYLTKPFESQTCLAVVDAVLEEIAHSSAGLRTGEHASQVATAQNRSR